MNKIPDFVAVDLETTGLEFEKDEIIEVALVRFEGGVPGKSIDFLVKPTEAVLRPFIEKLTGISVADLESADDFASIAGKICSFIGDLPLVNPIFHLVDKSLVSRVFSHFLKPFNAVFATNLS